MKPNIERSDSKPAKNKKPINVPALRKSQAVGDHQDALQLMKNDPAQFEATFVHSVYNVIAQDFSGTRYKEWPLVSRFLEAQAIGSMMVDVGCGNGKYLGHQHLQSVGADYSAGLLEIAAAKWRGADCVAADGLKLPFKHSVFDCAISIAMLHHLSTHERRVGVLREIRRVLRPGALLLVTVWAREEGLTEQESLVPWSRVSSGGIQNRYYHFYEHGELQSEAAEAEFVYDENMSRALFAEDEKGAERGLDHGNYYAVFVAK